MDNIAKSHKSIKDRLTFAYLRKIKKWMFCPNCRVGKMSTNKTSTLWQCESCGYELSTDVFENDYVFWFCDECESYLNTQNGFNPNASKHICTSCGYENDTSLNNIKGICSDCGKVIPDSSLTICADCRIQRREKAVENLKTVGEVAMIIGAATVAAIANQSSQDSSNDYSDLSYLNDFYEEGDGKMTCANCGNTDVNSLRDEGDTFYCSKCCHRTRVDNGKDDLVECPYCHRMRDRKAMYCRWCNDATWEPSTAADFRVIDKDLRDLGC